MARDLLPRNYFYPALELLEQRLAPAIWTVTNLGDAGVGVGNCGDLRYCINGADAAGLNQTINVQAGLQGQINVGGSLGIGAVGRPLTLTIPLSPSSVHLQ